MKMSNYVLYIYLPGSWNLQSQSPIASTTFYHISLCITVMTGKFLKKKTNMCLHVISEREETLYFSLGLVAFFNNKNLSVANCSFDPAWALHPLIRSFYLKKGKPPQNVGSKNQYFLNEPPPTTRVPLFRILFYLIVFCTRDQLTLECTSAVLTERIIRLECCLNELFQTACAYIRDELNKHMCL